VTAPAACGTLPGTCSRHLQARAYTARLTHMLYSLRI